MLSKARRKQYTEGKPLTSRHPTRNQDAIEPELHILPMLLFLLPYQEQDRCHRRPLHTGRGHSGCVHVVGVLSAHERCVVMGVLVMEVVAEDVVHAGVSGDETGREEEDVEEGDTVEAVDVAVSAWGWCLCDSGYPNLSWLLIPVRNPRTRAKERYYEAHGRTRRIIERTFGLLKARFRCLHLTGGSLYYSPKKVCQIIVACCLLHNLALRRQVPFLQEDGPDGGLVAVVDPLDSEEEEAEEEDIDNRNNIIMQYFQ
ncbi:hypothetical protein NDU88_004671 [Pleurodeles waltl]|uniref:DDE Tnp4 domain-containing protein n=1 Tax=Pleurodeles waltl TaxID=8319 RepID=A0AAV7NK59_PLEWA|nr:hypothetical protein NDU88_004671 [Pleurodeles waltl]